MSDIRHSSVGDTARQTERIFLVEINADLKVLTKASVEPDLKLGDAEGNGSVDRNLHGNITVLH